MTMTTMEIPEIGALLARYPMEWWVAGMAVGAVVGALALAGLRTAQRHSPPLRRFLPVRARWVVLAAMGASACMLMLAGAILAELAESGRPGGHWGALDDAVAAGLQAQADRAVLRLFAALTHLGDAWALTAATLVIGAALWVRQHRLLAIGWLVALAGNGALTKILKQVFERVRPEHVHGIAQADGFSFPSGHTSGSMAAYAMLAYLATRLLPRHWHLPVVMMAGAVIFTAGWSRVVLQVHYASDVLAGWLLAGTWVLCTVLVMESVARWRSSNDSDSHNPQPGLVKS